MHSNDPFSNIEFISIKHGIGLFFGETHKISTRMTTSVKIRRTNCGKSVKLMLKQSRHIHENAECRQQVGTFMNMTTILIIYSVYVQNSGYERYLTLS